MMTKPKKRMEKAIVTFVVDRDIDHVNHGISLKAYQNRKDRKLEYRENKRYEKILTLPLQKQKKEIDKELDEFYKQESKLKSVASDVNKEWRKIEGAFFKKLEAIHEGNAFPDKKIRGVLSFADGFGYNTQEKWFATSANKNKFAAIDTAVHELMHFMFHKYYEDGCKERGLSRDDIWDIKESFTALINLELAEFRFFPDHGYPSHRELRKVIEKVWKKSHNFNKTLEAAIKFVDSK